MQPTPPIPHRKRNKKYNTEGHAHFLTCSCYQRMPLLTNDAWRVWLAEAIRDACDKHAVAVWAYVFMPEHIHLLLKPRRAFYDIAKYEHDFKLACSRRVISFLAKSRSPLLDKLRISEPGERARYRFWQRGGGHDLNVWSMKKAVEKAEYCHWNPIKRRLVKSPAQWRFSSFRWLVLNQKENQPMQVDDWDEALLGPPSATALI
jgi:putative transposase